MSSKLTRELWSRFKKDSSKWWHKSYIVDYLIPAIIFGITFGITSSIKPYHRYLPPNDPSTSYPLQSDIVPLAWALVFLWAGCAVIVLIYSVSRKSSHDFHHGLLSLYVCCLVVNTITSILKVMAGRYRPDWHDAYAPRNMNEGRYSFPSGHSSNAWASMMWLVLYLYGKYQVHHPEVTSGFGTSIAVSSPLAVSFFIAISRTMDYHHNFDDIIGGSLLGILCAYYAYFLYYPSLSALNCDKPKQVVQKRQTAIHSAEPLKIGEAPRTTQNQVEITIQ